MMAAEDPMPGDGLPQEEIPDIPWLAPPREHKPVESPVLLAVGILLFALVLASSWIHNGKQSGVGFQHSLEARTRTYIISLLLDWQLREIIPPRYASALSPQQLARETARQWSTISRDEQVREQSALLAMNAAALYGVAEQPALARAGIRRAAQRDPVRATAYRALLPLYANTPRPVTLSSQTRGIIGKISAGPLILARNALLRDDQHAAITALQPGAQAGLRLLVINGSIILLLLGVLLVAGIIFLTRYRRITTVLAEVGQSPPPPVPWGVGTALIVVSATYLLVQVLGGLTISIISPGAEAVGTPIVISVVATIVCALIVLSIFQSAQGRSLTNWNALGWRPTSRGIRYALLVLLLSLPLVWAATLLSNMLFEGQQSPHPLIPYLLMSRNLLLQLVILFAAVVMAPLVEETLFRGILFRALEARMPFWSAAALSGALFAVVHGQLVAVLPITVLGMVFAFLLRRSGSLLAPAVARAVLNGISTIIALLAGWALRGPGS
ncbi:MAG: CPBP family intramembrane metalloprotease [Gammaproteobacteria bacterium]|nr:CPBP family intramembrane metalloprotease [Gammaproteobacteria bacterium]